MRIYVIEDEFHTEEIARFETKEEVEAKLDELAQTPWDIEPNQAPCEGWKTCGRDYIVIEYDSSEKPWMEVARKKAFSISASGVVYHRSPFDLPLATFENDLPASLRDQYLSPADSPYEIVLGGRMKTIWHRPPWIRPLLWLLSRGDILFPETGADIPTALVVTPGCDDLGRPIQTWERTFHFPNGVRRRYRSVMVYDPASGRIIELQGPGNRFEEIAEMRFTPPGTLEFLTVDSRLRIGSRRFHIPRRLWIQAHVVQTVDPANDASSRVTLTITHGILGKIFGYDGSFTATRRKRRA